MSVDPLDMTGMWQGTYVYPAHVGPTTPFVAVLREEDGRLTGTTMEPGPSGFPGSEELNAELAGSRSGRSVDFIKTYDGQVWDDVVDYVGQLSPDGPTVTGVWSNNDLDGTFEMHRDMTLEELVETEEAVELPEER